MRRSRFVIDIIALAALLVLVGCRVHNGNVIMLKPTFPVEEHSMIQDTVADPEEKVTEETYDVAVDIDFRQAIEPEYVDQFWSSDTYTVEKYELTIPSITPVEIAHGLDDMNGVVYVGTDEDGRQYLAIFDTASHSNKKVYTAADGMKIVSVMENAKRKDYDETAAYSWVETDGDYWRIMFNDSTAKQPDYVNMNEFIYEEGRISEGSGFIPKYDEDTRVSREKLALVSHSDRSKSSFLFRGNELPVNTGIKLQTVESYPVWAIGPEQIVYATREDETDCLNFDDVFFDSCKTTPFVSLSYKLPEDEKIDRILSGAYWGDDACNVSFISNKGNYYEYVGGHSAPFLIGRNVHTVLETQWGYTFFIDDSQTSLIVWNGCVGELPLTEQDSRLTGMAEGYMTVDIDDPYKIFIFAEEEGHQYVYCIVMKEFTRNIE